MKTRRGRPRAADPKVPVNLRMTATERARYEAAAAHAGRTMSEWCIVVLNRAAAEVASMYREVKP